jgi:hypothetical protein
MIDYGETDGSRKMLRKKVSDRINSHKKFNVERNLMSAIYFLVPAFVPLLFNYIPLPSNAIYYQLLIDKINVLKLSNALLGDNGYYRIIFWGYTFSIIYLVLVSPYIYHFQKKYQGVFISVNTKQKMALLWFLAACILITLFSQITDMSSTDSKIGRLFVGSCYFFPFFYGYFIMPIYMAMLFIITFLIHRGRPVDNLYKDEYYSSYKKDN